VNLLVHVLIAGALTAGLIPLYARVARWRGQLEAPEARSMHAEPLPAGVGIIPISLVLGLWATSLGSLSSQQVALAAACAGLTTVSWIDDLRRLPAFVRLIAQAFAVACCLYQLPADARAVPWLSLGLERGLEALAWVWFINLFNFMDGIDGLAASEAVSVNLGYAAIIVVLAGSGADLLHLALLIVASMLGYLVWNWHPARVLMGDAGAVPLGFLIGWLMLDLCLRGQLAAAFILPLYFLADSTFTLLARLLRGRPPHEPHREHIYQRAAVACRSQARVVMAVALANAGLLALALLSILRADVAVGLACGVVLLLVTHLERLAKSSLAAESRK
jgi:UDP-N-acetylmuramyl pentapeptide phosphotransferase/UDP-N-acetylglucosamine-1-phosphate transferase